jgi:hypothetical protein
MMNDELPAEPLTAILFDYETEKVSWHNAFGKSEGHFTFTGSGKFHYCFGNGSGGYKTEDEKDTRDNKKLQGHPLDDDHNYDYENYDGELRTIGFTLRVRPLEGTEAARLMQVNTQGDENAADIQNNRLIDLSTNLRDKMELLLDHQEYIKKREATHRHVVEQTYTMVMKWTLLETFVLICVAAAQVMYLKRFFETKRYL